MLWKPEGTTFRVATSCLGSIDVLKGLLLLIHSPGWQDQASETAAQFNPLLMLKFARCSPWKQSNAYQWC